MLLLLQDLAWAQGLTLQQAAAAAAMARTEVLAAQAQSGPMAKGRLGVQFRRWFQGVIAMKGHHRGRIASNLADVKGLDAVLIMGRLAHV